MLEVPARGEQPITDPATDIRNAIQKRAQEASGGVRRYLDQVATMYPQREDWTYSSKEGLLLAGGQQFTRRVPVEPYGAKMRYKQCYENAYQLVMVNSTDLVYCEGYAASLIAVPHAWAVVRGSGAVVDPTWDFEDEDVDYFGIPLKLQFISRWLVQTGHWGLFGGDHEDVLDLLRDGLPAGAKEQV